MIINEFFLLYGIYGLRAMECIRLKAAQIEAAKKNNKKSYKKNGNFVGSSASE